MQDYVVDESKFLADLATAWNKLATADRWDNCDNCADLSLWYFDKHHNWQKYDNDDHVI